MNFHKLVFIGLIYQFFDFDINGFDILPDFIEYAIVAYAFAKLNYRYAKVGKLTSLLLMILSFISIFTPEVIESTSASLAFTVSGTLFVVMNIFYFACIFAVSNQLVQDSSRKFPKVFIALLILTSFSVSLAVHLPVNAGNTLLLVTLGVSLIGYIYLFVFIWKRIAFEDAKRAEKSTGLLDADFDLE